MAPASACLSAREKKALAACWDKVIPEASEVGAEVMYRFLLLYPDTKSHFTHFDLSQGSHDLLVHGGKILNAIGDAIKGLDNLPEVMASVTDLHTNKLNIDPVHFKALSSIIQVTLARHYPQDFTPELHHAWNKCLHMLSNVLLNTAQVVKT